MLASGRFNGLWSRVDMNVLIQETARHISMENANTEIFSYFTTKKAYLLKEILAEYGSEATPGGARQVFDKLDEKYFVLPVPTKSSDTQNVSFYIYTNYGRSVQALNLPPLTQSEYDACIDIAEMFPGITILGLPTSAYNCHSYAWNMEEGGITCWINDPTPYMYYDYYEETSAANATKIYMYYNNSSSDAGYHSAIPASNGKVISKWGSSVCALHSLTECPYNIVNSMTKYYRPRTSYLQLGISGDDIVDCGESYLYSLPGCVDGASYFNIVWSATDYHERENASSITQSGRTATITFNYPTEYSVQAKIYCQGVQVAYAELAVNSQW